MHEILKHVNRNHNFSRFDYFMAFKMYYIAAMVYIMCTWSTATPICSVNRSIILLKSIEGAVIYLANSSLN